MLLRMAFVALLAAPLVVAAQSNLGDNRLAPIDDPLHVQFGASADLTAEKVHQAIEFVAPSRDWQIVSEAPGVLQLRRLVSGRHMMKIEIAYDAGGYDIRYLDSQEMLYRIVDVPGRQVRAIHRNYNVWIRELATSINAGLRVNASVVAERKPRADPALAAAASAASSSSSANTPLPQPGDYWKYSFRDERYKRRPVTFVVDVVDVHGGKVVDVLGQEGTDAGLRLKKSVDSAHFAFVGRRIHQDYVTFELAPYLADSDAIASLKIGDTPGNVPREWKARVTNISKEQVEVPAGTFETIRVEVTEDVLLGSANVLGPRRRIYTFWYAAAPKRYVMMRHQAWTQGGAQSADEIVKLTEYSVGGTRK
jgi:hypothetical protein